MISRDDRVRMERAHVSAWPALNAAVIDGWLWRSSGGGSQRANSVSTVDFHGADLEAAIAEVEARYAAVGAAARFQTFDETSPPALAALLRARGYRQGEPTTTMFKRIGATGAMEEVEIRNAVWGEWLDVYLAEITENRRAANTLILRQVPAPSAFFGWRRDGALIATALCVVSFGCAVIECVATRSAARRQGAAQSVLGALEHWVSEHASEGPHHAVDWTGLQVASGNTPAETLYQRLGFVAGATNTFWVR